ncbi:MAG: cytochrome c family protein [Candidatus Zixiibacteriota bacterium]
MKKLALFLVLIAVGSFLIFNPVFSQTEKTMEPTDTVKKVMTKQETATTTDTTKQETAATTDTTKQETKVVHKYIGTAKCKMCHNSEAKGKIYDKWVSTGHANAYKTLLNEQSIAIAKKMSIDDASKSDKCLRCHVTGYKEPSADKYSMEEGVTCEACHGPGSDYWTMKIMQDKKMAMANGLVEPTEKLCVACHNTDSPTYKPFKYADAYKLVEHHAPKAAPTPEKK